MKRQKETQEDAKRKLRKWREWAKGKISTNGSLGKMLRERASDVSLRSYFDERDKIIQGEYDAYQCEKALEKLMNSNKVCAILSDLKIEDLFQLEANACETIERAIKLLKENTNEKA